MRKVKTVNKKAMQYAKVYDETIHNFCRIFHGGTSIVETTQLTNTFGKEYKVASLLKDLCNRLDDSIPEKTLDRIIEIVYGDGKLKLYKDKIEHMFIDC